MRYILTVALYLMPVAQSIDWCSLDCDKFGKTEKNTMCTYKPQTGLGNCKNIKDTNTADKRKEMLHLHNEYRNKIAAGLKGWPAAANMRKMSWDNTLEAVALRWAQQCKPGHDDCRRTPEFKIVGQNYGMLANSAFNPESSVDSFKAWVDEISLAKPSLVDNFQGGVWGHFTQVIWAETYKVGCAQVQFTEAEKGINWHRTVLICNYGPMGNFVNDRIYQKGDACTKCPQGLECKSGSAYPKLCGDPSGGKEKNDEIDGKTKVSASGKPACLDPILMGFTFLMVN